MDHRQRHSGHLAPGKSRSGVGTSVPKDTGMAGYPAYNQAGIIATALFDSTLKPGGMINVQSDLTPACGAWVIYNLDYDLDPMIPHGKWFCTIGASRIQGGGLL
jgi:hypothetical protein